MQHDFHVAYWIAPNLISGVNVEANDEVHAMHKAYKLKQLEVWNVVYVHNRSTNTLSMMEDGLQFFPLENFYS